MKTLANPINYLRISITDRCNLRCFYCTPWGGWQKLPSPEILRYEELLHLARVAVAAGIKKIRVTGGEPLVRRDVVEFVANLHQVPGLTEICLTSNGVRLAPMAEDLYAAGLRHLNLSLDTLRRDRYRELTGSDHFTDAFSGLQKALAVGFTPLKLNFVALKGINDDELLDFALLARDHPLQVRFIEFMPSVGEERWRRHFLPIAEIHRRLQALGPMDAVAAGPTAGPARIFRPAGFQGELGFISSITQHHCPTCNRLRLTAAGLLNPCLFGTHELDLKGPLRRGASESELVNLFRQAMHLKDDLAASRQGAASSRCRAMVSIGG